MLHEYERQLSIFLGVILLIWIYADYSRAFRNRVMKLDLGDVLSPHFLPVFKSTLNMGKHGIIGFQLRYFLWTGIVFFVLAVIGWLATEVPKIGTVVEGVLPQFYTEIREASLDNLRLVRISAVALLLYAVMQIPGNVRQDARTALGDPISPFRRALAFYARARDYYIEAWVLKNKFKELETNLVLDLQEQRLDDNRLSDTAREELFDELKGDCGQPDASGEWSAN